MDKTAKNIIMAIITIACLFLIVTGQRNISLQGLAMELVGLAGLLILLYFYNRRYK